MIKQIYIICTISVFLMIGVVVLIAQESTLPMTTAQEKALLLKASFSIREAPGKAAIVKPTEVNALFSKKGGYDGNIFSTNGRTIAQIELTGQSDGESDIYNVTFTDINGKRLGTFNNLVGLAYMAGDGEHFVNFYYHILRFYQYTGQQPIREHSLSGAQEVKLSGDGSRVLVATVGKFAVVLYCFTIRGEPLWKSEFPNTSLNHITINYDGSYSALVAFVIPPEAIEATQRRKKILSEAKRKWDETNKKRRRQGLPPVKFERPSREELTGGYKKKKRSSETVLIFVNRDGIETGRTEPGTALYKNVTFSKAEDYLTASNRSEILLFDAASAQILQKTKLDIATEIISLDVNNQGKIAAATITHTTKDQRGRVIDKGGADPRAVILWNTATGELKSHGFESNIKIPRGHFTVSLSGSGDNVLVRAADQVIVLGN